MAAQDRDTVKEEIRQRVDIVDLISEHVALKRSGRNYKGLCPFHPEKTPSFNVRRDLGFWKCFGCGASGDVFDFVMRRESLAFPEALERLGERAGVRVERSPAAARQRSARDVLLDANAKAGAHFHRNLLSHPSGQPARDHLEHRGIDAEAIERYQLGYARQSWDDLLNALRRTGVKPEVAARAGLVIPRPTGGGHYDRFRHRLIFPIFDVSGRVIGFGGRALAAADEVKYINSPESPVFSKGRVLYGLNWAHRGIADAGLAVVVEGYTDVIALQTAGIANAVATLGTALTEDHVTLLARYAQEVVLAYDADSAGMTAAINNAAIFENAPASVRLVRLPPGEDPDDFVRQHGTKAFQDLVSQRESLVEYALARVFERHGQDERGLKQAIEEAAEFLRPVDSPATRAACLARIAERFFKNRVQAEAVQQAVLNAIHRTRRRPRPRAQAAAKPSGPDAEEAAAAAVARSVAGTAPGCLEDEAAVLAAALQDAEIARRLQHLMPSGAFLLEADQAVAQCLYEAIAAGRTGARAVAEALPLGEARDRAVELSVIEVDVALVGDTLQALVGALKAHRRRQGGRRLYAAASAEGLADSDAAAPSFAELTRQVTQALADGEITQDDPLYQQWLERSRELHGSGALDYWEGP